MARRVGVVVAALAAVWGMVMVAEAQTKANLPGVYLGEGINPDGSPYRALVEIAAVEKTYLVRWTLADDSQVWGVGIFNGGVLAVSYFGGAPAVVVYQMDGERLVGEWTIGGAEGRVYSETLTRIPAGQRAPTAPKPAPGRIAL